MLLIDMVHSCHGAGGVDRKEVGLFASRAPHRPNALALSALRLSNVDTETRVLTVEGKSKCKSFISTIANSIIHVNLHPIFHFVLLASYICLGIDLLDETPILDIKPYIPAFDSFPDAAAGWMDHISTNLEDNRKLGYQKF